MGGCGQDDHITSVGVHMGRASVIGGLMVSVLVAWSNEGVWASSIGGKTKAGRCMAIECWLVGGLDVWSHGTVDRMYKKGECEKGEERRDNVG